MNVLLPVFDVTGIYFDVQEITPPAVGDHRFNKNDEEVCVQLIPFHFAYEC